MISFSVGFACTWSNSCTILTPQIWSEYSALQTFISCVACMWICAFLLLCVSGQAETSAVTGSAMFYTHFFKNNVTRHAENFGFKMCFTTCGYVTYSTFCMWVAAVELEACSMVAVIAVDCCKQEMVSRMKWNMNTGSLQHWLFMAFWEVCREIAIEHQFWCPHWTAVEEVERSHVSFSCMPL